MPNSSEINNWLFEEGFAYFNQPFTINYQSSFSLPESMCISDSTFLPSDIIDVSMEPLAFSSADYQDYMSFKERLSNNQSTQIFRVAPKRLVDFKDIEEFENRFTDTLLHLIHEEIFEFGMENAADMFVQEHLKNNPFVTKNCINSIFLKNFANIGVTTGLLRIIAHLNYTEIEPTGPTIAVAALSHENAEVRECGIRAFENWEDISSLEYLKHIKCKEQWLQDYLEQVIIDLEEIHVLSG